MQKEGKNVKYEANEKLINLPSNVSKADAGIASRRYSLFREVDATLATEKIICSKQRTKSILSLNTGTSASTR